MALPIPFCNDLSAVFIGENFDWESPPPTFLLSFKEWAIV